jgi:3',5'-cyclic AMP phosphodiesterase CpdA
VTDISVFHCSDLHFGHPAVPEQYEALEALIQQRRHDVVAISGDLSQRSRAGEFQRARVFLQNAERVSKVIVVPGNHDVAWWFSPLGLGDDRQLLKTYRRYINNDIEPVLRLPGATFVGVNTSHGITFRTLTWNMRDLSIIGFVREEQLARAAAQFASVPPGDARVLVLHHNAMKGELSRRHGLRNSARVHEAMQSMQVDLVLCGHDHQESVHFIEHPTKRMTVSTAGTISDRGRGGRPSSANSIRITSDSIDVQTLIWSAEQRAFVDGARQTFAR